ncbi:MAG: Permeases of the major facilitator superfamily [Parcubacteria group bacterium GW2011_GWF2_38_8]|nr:MAG: Permeases of the major facilitator superfamily [Parcubacteria group bacterium GW2011_GWF2_38_8]
MIKHNRKIIYLAGFLFSVSIALTSYINSSFLEIYAGKNYIGIIYVIASVITILGLLRMPKILTRIGNRKTILLFCFFIFLSLLLLALGNTGFIVIPAFILYFVSINFVIASLDIFIEDFSGKSRIGTLRGFYLMIINSAWIIAQLISGSVINKSSFSGLYLLAASFMILVGIIFTLCLRDFKDPNYIKVPVWKTIKSFWHNRYVSKIYLSHLILQFFYAWMIIYMPIYLHEYMGFGWDKIGIIFSIMLIPFVILDFPLGKLSDKIGEKKMLIMGFSIIVLSVLAIPFIKESVIWIWALMLFLTRVGAATIEVMNESYFFKEINEKNADEISFFRNAPSISYIIAPLIAFPILFLIPSFEYLFFILGAVLLIGLFITLRLKDVK